MLFIKQLFNLKQHPYALSNFSPLNGYFLPIFADFTMFFLQAISTDRP